MTRTTPLALVQMISESYGLPLSVQQSSVKKHLQQIHHRIGE
jgi:hypothetical protein